MLKKIWHYSVLDTAEARTVLLPDVPVWTSAQRLRQSEVKYLKNLKKDGIKTKKIKMLGWLPQFLRSQLRTLRTKYCFSVRVALCSTIRYRKPLLRFFFSKQRSLGHTRLRLLHALYDIDFTVSIHKGEPIAFLKVSKF